MPRPHSQPDFGGGYVTPLPNYHAQAGRQRSTYAKGNFADCFRKPFPCPKCGRCFTVKGNMTRHHKYECGQAPRFQCPYCEFRSKQTSNVMSHIRSRHTGQKVHVGSTATIYVEEVPSECPRNIRANNDVSNLTMLDSLMNTSKPGNTTGIQDRLLHYCPRCLHGFTLKSNRNRHYKYECGYEPRFKCPYCELKSKQTSQVYCHIRKKHPTEKEARKYQASGIDVYGSLRRRRSKKKNYVCPKCGNGYTVVKSLKRHLRYECGVAPRFKCPYCGTRSKQRAHVNEHIQMKRIKIETDLENLCSVVMEEAKDYDYEEERPPLGGSRRRRAATLRDIERHTCSRCSKSYIHAWHLKRHTKFECGQEPRVQCPYCAARMKQRGHVYRHIRQCHRGQNVYVIDLN
ncbi:Zinc finger protein [Apis cerana cerana]|uniref:Zinc finger protein n=1 Tax=Apis cerana cerana TaxID=94128 RepID=A0A2A3EQS6_APICC|nr:Zinc finger protein [Apis cerana cerana]